MITRLIGQLTEKQLEQFLHNLSSEGRQYVKTLLHDEDTHIKRLTMDYKLVEHRKLAMKPNKSDEESNMLQAAPKTWAGRVDGKKVSVSPETINAVNGHLQTYEVRKRFLAKSLDQIKEQGELFFGVPVAKYLRDYKTFKRLLMLKTLEEPKVIRNYIIEFQEAYNQKEPPRPFAPDGKLAMLALQLDEDLFTEYQKDLNNCVVSSLGVEATSMLETLMMKCVQADKTFNEQVWRETQDILPIFHCQHLRYLYHFFSMFLVNKKTSVLPRSLTQESIVAIIRKVAELC